MDAFEFARNGFFVLVWILSYGGAVLFAMWAVGLILHVLAVLIAQTGEDEDDE